MVYTWYIPTIYLVGVPDDPGSSFPAVKTKDAVLLYSKKLKVKYFTPDDSVSKQERPTTVLFHAT